MNIPRYEFDKLVPADHSYHCCGYPNHAPNKRSSDNLKVEEQELYDGRKSSNSLVPVEQLKNNLYPIVWIPPDYLKERENTKYEEQESARRVKEKHSREMRPAETQRVSPSISNPRGWSVGVPLGLNELCHLIGDAHGKKTQSHQNQDEKEQSPFPLIWIPYYNDMKTGEAKEEVKEDNQEPAPIKPEDVAPRISSFPVRQPEGGDKVDVPWAIQDICNGQVALDEKKNVGQRSIPVKQIEETHPEDSMKNQDNSTGDKISGSNAERLSSSPTKASKLPPVCLRVDPLPKKRNGKVASRSPSPTGTKVKQEASKNQSLMQKESHHGLPVQNDTLVSNDSVEAKKNEGKAIPVEESKSSESQVPVTSATDSENKAARSLAMEKKEEDSYKSTTEEVEKAEVARDLVAEGESKTKEVIDMPSSDTSEHKGRKRELTDEEAAKLIQSLYRGFSVRRWEPLKKLKEIARVREKVAEVRDQIQTLEFSFDPQKDGRQQLVIGETIMSLLLKLDTIQGLQPSLRVLRKSLARELITLQEKLDMFMPKKSEGMTEIPTVHCNGKTREPEGQSSNISLKGDIECDQALDSIIAKDESNTFEQEAGELPTASESSILKEEDFAEARSVEYPNAKVVPSEREVATSERADSVETRIVVPDISEGRGKSEELEDDQLAEILIDLKELPQAVIEEEPTEQERAIAADGEREPSLVPGSFIGDHNLLSAEVPCEPDLANELPVGVIDEQDSENHEMTQMREHGALCGEGATAFPASELLVAVLNKDEPMEEESSEVQSEDSGSNRYKVEEETEEIEKKDVLIDLSEQQPIGPLTESARLPVTEFVKVNGDTGHEVFEGDKQLQHAVDADNKSKVVEATNLAGREQASLPIRKVSYDGLCGGERSHISVQRYISDTSRSNMEEEKQTKEGENVPKPTMKDEKVSLKEQADVLAEYLRDANKPVVLENAEEESDNVSFPSPEYEERDQDALGALPPPCDSQLSIKEHDIADRRILEENRQLKEMVEKLVEAGKEQLNVISSLIGRVKDLEEKKLSRKKKERSRRFRVPPRPCLRQPNELQRNRAVGKAR